MEVADEANKLVQQDYRSSLQLIRFLPLELSIAQQNRWKTYTCVASRGRRWRLSEEDAMMLSEILLLPLCPFLPKLPPLPPYPPSSYRLLLTSGSTTTSTWIRFFPCTRNRK
mmetsp:Transcript_3906/g.9635  ORF Transcript_3906/g.9635 Transcript_3906/m.9635 type:complete len:112 (-) Transcript_3906:21-356(-)